MRKLSTLTMTTYRLNFYFSLCEYSPDSFVFSLLARILFLRHCANGEGAFLSSLSVSLRTSFLHFRARAREREREGEREKRRPQVITHIHNGKRETRLSYFLHARTCRNKGRPGKGRVGGHEGTSDSRDVAPRKWIQLNSHTRRARLSRNRDVRSLYTRGNDEKKGREGGRRRETNLPTANVFIFTKIPCKRNSTSRKFRRCQFEETISSRGTDA